MLKSQASLEMVIGLVILLVVAAVVISLVIYYINPKRVPNPSEELSVRAFLQKCEEYCSSNDINAFCTYYYQDNDWNKNGIKYEVVNVGKYNWPTCEDRVYCFLVVPCEDKLGSGISAIEKCKEILCQTYIEKYNDVNLASEALHNDINFSNRCNLDDAESKGLIKPEDNWYKNVFEGGCGAAGVGGAAGGGGAGGGTGGGPSGPPGGNPP